MCRESVERKKLFLRNDATTIDPVCGVSVDEKETQHQTHYGGQTYSFCSRECKDKFEEKPQQYARAAA